jgi:signal transduction histidine kinase/HAMP domain-containing protein
MAAIPETEMTGAIARRTSRGRLFRKYLLLILSLVTIALLASGAISVYFTYQETKSSLASLQHEKALAAASRIEQYVGGIERQLAYAALPQLDASDVELRRIEFLKLLRQAPEVTDIAQLDAKGREQIAVSRLGMDNVGSNKDRSQEPAFRNAKRGQPWFGPVYFRKETEPYMTIALRSGGDNGPVIVTDVNLKFIWDVVSRIKIGEKGKAYVVDGNGFLIADPDIGLVLRKTDLSQLAHVQAALAATKADEPTLISADLGGTPVLTSVAPIESLHWNVFVEQPVAEVYEKLNAAIVRTGVLLLVGLALSAFGALALARGMVRPIRTLELGAERIGSGNLDQRIEVHTGDELEALADRFNRMSVQLKESYAGLERKVEERTKELQNSLEQQTAISEILRVISSSPTNVQPVLDAVAERAAHLCDSPFARVLLADGDMLRPAAFYSQERDQELEQDRSTPLKRSSINGRAVLDRETIHIADLPPLFDTEYPDARENAVPQGVRAALAVPLLREGAAYGSIFIFRRHPGPFSPDQVALLETFARQAAIAIDNVRLFNETREALEQQTAVAEILRVISSSPTDVQPVLDAIAQRAERLCDASAASIFLTEGDTLRHAVSTQVVADEAATVGTLPISRDWVSGRALLERRTIQVPDMLNEAAEYPVSYELAKRFGHRAVLVTPLYREGHPVGTIMLRRQVVRAFTEREIALLKTFGDQAAIALENVRLFNETKEALEQQRASGEVLATISGSIADTAPVFEKILSSCERLFAGKRVAINLVGEDGHFRLGAYHGPGRGDLERLFPFPVDKTSGSGLAITTRSMIHFPDVEKDDGVPDLARLGCEAMGIKGVIYAPMLWENKGVGAIFVGRDYVGPFSDKDIALLKTFADQAVIAIQNARLFNETKEALDQQRASGEVLAAISSSIADTKPVFDVILQSCQRLFAGETVGVTLVRDDGLLEIGGRGPGFDELRKLFPQPLSRDTASGTAIIERRLIVYTDIETDDMPERSRAGCRAIRTQSIAFAPMLFEGRGIGVLWVGRPFKGAFSEKQLALLKTFAEQAVIAIQNARLFSEIQDKSRQLEIANKHKSEFLANMSHELRTPLNAIIGFSEVMLERLFGEVNEKQADYLNDIHSSGKHLLSLINDILDLSKIEAGRMELEPSTFEVSAALSNAMTLVRERAQRHSIVMGQQLDSKLGEIVADERKFKQIVLNLLSNAVKFTPDGGRIDVTARREDGNAVFAVSDTGIGIAPEDQASVFEEFRQVGSDYTRKQEGTGLGLTLTKKFVELHGGKIWLESEPGKGSTFTFTIPLRP